MFGAAGATVVEVVVVPVGTVVVVVVEPPDGITVTVAVAVTNCPAEFVTVSV